MPTPVCRCRTVAAAWQGRQMRRGGASTSAATARSCRSTTARSASFPRRGLADVRAQVADGRSAHHVRRSGFLQRTDPRDDGCGCLHAEFPAHATTSTIKIEHLLEASRTCSHDCATPAACSSRAPSSRSTIAMLEMLDKGSHARGFRPRGRAVPRCRDRADADVCPVHPVDDHRGISRLSRDHRCARSRRKGGPDPARHPSADHGTVGPA